jgi:hypothetical protein
MPVTFFPEKDIAIDNFSPPVLVQNFTVYFKVCTLIKNKITFSSRKFRVEQLQSHI